ncbi:hypothetical protein [Leptospira sp. GIMC2001]|uniref:hypothetical protein n=1 Tax=Leptospira sp. GIMC2001 TaxID=1513297 RepID=UPI002349F06A|nr:hypothetical protein [Leptospira sp. GIMC2001]WCL49023.1 hypothetical protein O4O04_17285 [Leptospira sp. GIMC2001]
MSSIGYIGHGKLESAPENFSILHVVSHELGHVQEFKNQAFRDNSDITEIRVKIDMEMKENGKLVAVSGETSATTRSKPEKSNSDSLFEPYKNQKPNINKAEKKEESDLSEKTKNESDSKKDIKEWNLISRRDSLESRLKQLDTEIISLEAESLPKFSNNSNYAMNLSNSVNDSYRSSGSTESQSSKESNGDVQVSSHRKENLIRERRRLEEEVRLLKMEEDTKKNFQLLIQSQRDNIESAFRIGVSNGYKPGSLLDAQS